MSPVIVTRELSRTFRTYRKPEGLLNSVRYFFKRDWQDKVALAPTSLEIGGGQIVGLVGANGAGKTTLLKLLCGLIHASAGDARVLGHDPAARSPELLRRISILLGQKAQLWWDLPAADSFDLLARIYDLDLAAAKRRVAELADLMQCTSLLETQLRRLSLGERMKMEIIGALLHKPAVLFLDEPTIGLDIVAQSTIRKFLATYVEQEKPTVILTSHYMDDISLLADRLLLISHGRIVYDGTVEGFTARTVTRQRVTLKLGEPAGSDHDLGGGQVLSRGAEIFSGDYPAAEVAKVLERVMQVARITDVKIEETDFEDVIRTFLEAETPRNPATAASPVVG